MGECSVDELHVALVEASGDVLVEEEMVEQLTEDKTTVSHLHTQEVVGHGIVPNCYCHDVVVDSKEETEDYGRGCVNSEIR